VCGSAREGTKCAGVYLSRVRQRAGGKRVCAGTREPRVCAPASEQVCGKNGMSAPPLRSQPHEEWDERHPPPNPNSLGLRGYLRHAVQRNEDFAVRLPHAALAPHGGRRRRQRWIQNWGTTITMRGPSAIPRHLPQTACSGTRVGPGACCAASSGAARISIGMPNLEMPNLDSVNFCTTVKPSGTEVD
jgi:hypothetical protein